MTSLGVLEARLADAEGRRVAAIYTLVSIFATPGVPCVSFRRGVPLAKGCATREEMCRRVGEEFLRGGRRGMRARRKGGTARLGHG